MASIVAQLVEEFACNVGDLGSIPGLGRSPGEGKGYPLQYSGMENFMDCIDHGVAESRKQLSNFHFSMTSQRPHRQITSPWGLRLQHLHLEGYRHSVHSIYERYLLVVGPRSLGSQGSLGM